MKSSPYTVRIFTMLLKLKLSGWGFMIGRSHLGMEGAEEAEERHSPVSLKFTFTAGWRLRGKAVSSSLCAWRPSIQASCFPGFLLADVRRLTADFRLVGGLSCLHNKKHWFYDMLSITFNSYYFYCQRNNLSHLSSYSDYITFLSTNDNTL